MKKTNNQFAFKVGVVTGALILLFHMAADAKPKAAPAPKKNATPAKSAAKTVPAKPTQAASTRFTDKVSGFSLELPKGWEQQKDSMGAVIMAVSAQESANDKFRENINVVVENLQDSMSTKDYYNASQNVIKKVFNEYKQEKHATQLIDGHEFYYSVFNHKLGTIAAKVLQYVVVKNKRAFVITCSAEPDKFNTYKDKFDASIKSFKFEAASRATATKK